MKQPAAKFFLPLLLSITMIAGIFIGFKMRDSFPSSGFFSAKQQSSVEEIMQLLQSKYVDDVNAKQLSDTAIEAILSKLDPHTIYIDAKEVADINDEINGHFYGIGIEYEVYHDTFFVTHVLPNGPGDKAKLQIGDKITKANNKAISGKHLEIEAMVNLLRGDRNSTLSVEVMRNNKLITVPIIRDLIPVNSIEAAYMLDNKTGYIKINQFSTHTYKEFMIELTALKKAGMQNMVLDLRDNGGGVLDQAIEIVDELLEGDKLISYSEGKHYEKKEFRCRRQGQFETGDLILLCNEGSASASEVVLGALQDWDRGIIIGRRSFGKGLIQEQYDLQNGAALRLTIARYFTPLGRSIQKSYKNGMYAYYEEADNRSPLVDTFHYDSSMMVTSPKGKHLFGGGGIRPDYFMPSDTTRIQKSTGDFIYKNMATQFAIPYYNKNKKTIAAFQNAVNFSNQFQFSTTDWESLESFASTNNISLDKIPSIDKIFIIENLKSTIARWQWNKNGYYQVMQSSDPYIQKSMSILNR